jgi:hypothetical protein
MSDWPPSFGSMLRTLGAMTIGQLLLTSAAATHLSALSEV